MIRIISLTEAGRTLANHIQAQLLEKGGATRNEALSTISCHHKPAPFKQTIQSFFQAGDRLILICAMGIAVRTLAPVLKNKHEDPAVLVLDEEGEFVIPLLSGHEGGANHWSYVIAKLLYTQPVITTAKPYLKPIYTLGMGCERDCPLQYLVEIRDLCLDKAGLSLGDINSVHSIDIKADERGLIDLSLSMNTPFRTWSKDFLTTVEHQLSTKSEYIFRTVGVYGVAESAALLGASQVTGDEAELVLFKHKNAKATCAIAKSYPPKDPNYLN